MLHAAFVLAGLATFLLGPILPLLSRQWQLSDQQAGLLLLAQFTGATLGGATLSRSLPLAFLSGLVAAALGFAAFGVSPGLYQACAAIALAGFGVGRVIASVNIIAGNRYTELRGSALARLNISFSLGCLLSPLLAAQLTARFPLADLIAGVDLLFAGIAFAALLEFRRHPPEAAPVPDSNAHELTLTPSFLLFVAILFLYGGLETCLSGWLTTYVLRYGQSSLVLSQYVLVLLLCGLTGGRFLAASLLKIFREPALLRASLLLTMAAAAVLAFAHTAAAIAVLAIVLGVVLAPVFPASFALYMATRPTPRLAGLVLAASGLGAAAIPWLMGVVSTQARSLRVALTLPVAAAVALLLLSFPAGRARPIP